jgi:hypothetical protein
VSDGQDDNLARRRVKYDTPIADAQAQRGVTFQPLDLVTQRQGIERDGCEGAVDSASDDRSNASSSRVASGE